jgi:hypothetical protein
MSTADLTERALEKMERDRDPEVIPSLVSTIRQQQHDLDSLRLALEVARRDREELRAALIAMRSGREDRESEAG